MATVTLSSTTSMAEALALAGALLDWCAAHPDDPASFQPLKAREYDVDGAVVITTAPLLELVK